MLIRRVTKISTGQELHYKIYLATVDVLFSISNKKIKLLSLRGSCTFLAHPRHEAPHVLKYDPLYYLFIILCRYMYFDNSVL